MFVLKKVQEEENTRGQEENLRGRKHKKTRRLLTTDIKVPTSHSGFLSGFLESEDECRGVEV